MPDETEGIAAGLRRGSRQAWAALYGTYAERLWREVARLTGGTATDVADVVQEVILAAANGARHFDPQHGSLWNWLMGIARRQVALQFRQRTSRLENARRWWLSRDGSAGQWVAGSCDAPPNALESKELVSLVRVALFELPMHYQTLLTCKYLDGLSAEEICGRTGGSPDAVRARLPRARRAFRKVFLRLAGGRRHGSRS